MYKNNDKVTDGKEQSSSFIEYMSRYTIPQKSCVYKKEY